MELFHRIGHLVFYYVLISSFTTSIFGVHACQPDKTFEYGLHVRLDPLFLMISDPALEVSSKLFPCAHYKRIDLEVEDPQEICRQNGFHLSQCHVVETSFIKAYYNLPHFTLAHDMRCIGITEKSQCVGECVFYGSQYKCQPKDFCGFHTRTACLGHHHCAWVSPGKCHKRQVA